VAWSRLFHVYGVAADTALHLDALSRDDLTAVDDESADGFHTQVPYSYLWSALYGGGRLTPATVPALRNLAGMVTDPDFGRDDETLREGVLYFIHEIARTVFTAGDMAQLRRLAAGRRTPVVEAWLERFLATPRPVFDWTDDDQPGQVLMAAALVDCHDLLPEVYTAIEPLLHEPWPARTRQRAAHAAARLVSHPDLTGQRTPLLDYHERLAATVADVKHRASLVAGIGQLGGQPHAWLNDGHLGVRTCAALAPALATDPAALELLMAVSRAPRALNAAFGEDLSSRTLHPCAAQVADTVCRRVDDFERLFDSALATLPFNAIWLTPHDARQRAACEPYLRVAFLSGLPEPGRATGTQRAFANAALDRDELWADPDGPWLASLRHLGLPADRLRWHAAGQLFAGPTDDISDHQIGIPAHVTLRSFARLRPTMFAGAQRTDPDLPTRLVELALESMRQAGAHDARIVITDDQQFTMDSGAHLTPYLADAKRPDLELMCVPPLLVPGLPPPFSGIGTIAAYCARITANAWVDGTAYTQEFVDGISLTPLREVGHATRTGFQVTFHLDTVWLPRAARILDLVGTHRMIIDRRPDPATPGSPTDSNE